MCLIISSGVLIDGGDGVPVTVFTTSDTASIAFGTDPNRLNSVPMRASGKGISASGHIAAIVVDEFLLGALAERRVVVALPVPGERGQVVRVFGQFLGRAAIDQPADAGGIAIVVD